MNNGAPFALQQKNSGFSPSGEKHRFLPSVSSERRTFRWSIKEAAYKALQPSMELRWKEISFIKDSFSKSRKPILRIKEGPTLGVKFHTSVSHDGDYVVTMVVAEVTNDL